MKKKNAEVQSRRDFFKKAVKAALPILGIAALASSPVVAKAAEVTMGCTGTCYGTCARSCEGCKQTCVGDCKNGCTGCQYTCSGSCAHSNRR